ncbi:EAL domain-containing protein [Massilia sp. TS11]|uniref:bifunctional diguanylate cyclase/phosphodiesterase n=1 Tax=Massilia sp. TS11 TaxID=2908003 RepID=UPI001EDB5B15|nr:EAL domain-containing protein [Massilia sp. TS11]MCG2586347.1 EAL domain-containing protein [Massilia sp. TS11]
MDLTAPTLRQDGARLLIWPLLALAILAALWSAVRWQDAEEDLQAEASLLREAHNYAQAYEHFLGRSLGQMDHISLQLKYDWEQSGGRLAMDTLLRQGMFADAAFAAISLYDAQGRLRSSTRPQLAPPQLADSPAFAYHRNHISTALRLQLPARGPHGQDWIAFSRRLDTADDGFDGVILLQIDAAYFTAFDDGLGLGPSGLVALRLLEDNGAIAQLASADGRTELLRDLPWPGGSSETGATLVPARAFPDGEARALGWQTVRAYPVQALVGLAQGPARAALTASQRARRQWATLASVLLGLAGLGGALASWRLLQRERAEQAIRAAYRTATEHANDGFFLVEPERDGRGQIHDFRLQDCNERGASFYGLGRAELIGMRLSQLHAGHPVYFAQLLHEYTDALHSGFAQSDVEMPRSGRMRLEWAQRTLVRAGPGLAVTLHDISRQKRHETELTKLANEDTLTGLPNRHWLRAELPRMLEAAGAGGYRLALLFIDLDGFKQVNDTLGHAAGDSVLAEVGTRLQRLLRPGDHVVRLGGDEFLVVLAPVESIATAHSVGERVLRALAQPCQLGENQYSIGASIGISCYPEHGQSAEVLLQQADIAMYAGKTDGKGQVRPFHPALFEHLQARSQARQALRTALAERQFFLMYQPRIDARSGQLLSMEALLRWQHPLRGTIGPGEFIALAESHGMMGELGALVMDLACAQLADWQARGLPLVPLSINVSPTQFGSGSVDQQLAEAMARHQVPAHLIEVEITESAMMGEQAEVQAQLRALRALGIRLHIDDFGTGYSSLWQLQRLQMDGLKVDRAFTQGLDQGSDGRILFEAIISMAHALGMTVVAEGVETPQQLAILQTLGCDEVQGFLLARPLPLAAIEARLSARQFDFAWRPARVA